VLSDPQLSPDGRRVAFVSGDRVGILTLADGATTWLDADCTAPRWSPDGRSLAVVRSTGLIVLAPDSWQEVSRLPTREPDSSGASGWGMGLVSDPAWGVGGRVACVVGDAIRVFGAGRRPLWTAAGGRYPRWSPDGARLAYLTDDGLYLAAASGPPVRVAEGAVRGFAWRPDGAGIAYLAPRRASEVSLRLWVVGLDGGVAVELTAGWALGVGNPVRGDDPRGTGDSVVVWSSATGRVYVEMAVGGRGPLAWFDPDRGSSGRVFEGDYVCLAPSVGGGRIAFVRTDPGNSGEVWVAEEGGVARAVALAPRAPVETVPVRAGAVDGWLTCAPGGSRPRPMLANVHGGPHYAVGWRYIAEVVRLAMRGYAVLTANLRGSQGYGEEFAQAIRGAWGGPDLEDLLSIVDAAAGHSTVDPDRVGVWGVSYGGFMALWAAASTARFRVAISENGLSELAPGLGVGDPLAHADRIRVPVLLVHAEQDRVVPPAHSERMHAALDGRGELVRIPGEGHLMNLVGSPAHRLIRARAVDRFLDRWLPAQSA
jgi:dipeptidyl aminopeptidase/acylaminoacyl peptidase